MFEKLIKNTKLKLASCLIGSILSIGCAEERRVEPLITDFNYSSYSSEKSINKVFITNEDIDISVGLRENVNRIFLEERRYYRDNTIENVYEMIKIPSTNIYSYKLSGFNDSGILCFIVKVDQDNRYINAREVCEPIFISEEDSHKIIKNWLDSKRTLCLWEEGYNIEYNEKDRTTGYVDEADFNLKKIKCILLNEPVIIEYVGENDDYVFSRDEEELLKEYNVRNLYIYPIDIFMRLGELTTKTDLENEISNFYY